MAGFVDSLMISIGLDTSKIEQGIAQIAQGLEQGIQGAVESASPAIDSLGEDFQSAAEEAEGLAEAASEAGEAAAAAGMAGTVAGKRGEKAAKEVTRAVRETGQEMKQELPRAAQQAAAGIESALGRVRAGFKNFIMQVVGPAMGAFAIGGAVQTFIQGATAAEEAAQAFDVSAEELQLWQGAITRAGGNVGKFELTLRKMTMSGKSAGDALKTLYNLAGQAEKMSRDAFTAKAKEMGIDVATIGVLVQGQKALDAHLKRAKEIGIYERRHIEQAKRLKIGLWELSGAFDGLKNEVLLIALPAMEKLLDVLTEVTLYLSAHPWAIVGVVSALGAALTLKLLPPLRALPGLIARAGMAFLRWMPWVAVIVGIGIAVDDLAKYLRTGKSQFDDFWKIFGSPAEIKAAWNNLKETVSGAISGMGDKVRSFFNTLSDWGVVDGLKDAFLGLGHLIHGVFTDNWDEAVEGAKGLAKGIWDALWGAISGVGAQIGAYFSKLWADIKVNAVREWNGYCDSIWSAITGVVDRVVAWVKEKWNGLLASLPVPDFLKDALGMAGPETEKAGGEVKDGMAETAATVKGGFNAAWTATTNFAVQKFNSAASTIKGLFAGILQDISAQTDQLALGAGAAALKAGGIGGRAATHAGAGGRAGNTDASVHIGQMNVHTRATDADGMARGASEALRRHRLSKPAASGVNQK